MKRWDLINYYINHYGFKTFLEIGHDKGEAFDNIEIEYKVSVDPNESTNATFCMTSDDFFEQQTEKFDMIFIDGLHEHSQVYRDICNSLAILNKGGVIVMHDCHPTTKMCQKHLFVYPGGAWTGDCWKAFIKARATLPYEMYVWDHDWGCGVIDTNIPKVTDTSGLPTQMVNMTYEQLLLNLDWLQLKSDIYAI